MQRAAVFHMSFPPAKVTLAPLLALVLTACAAAPPAPAPRDPGTAATGGVASPDAATPGERAAKIALGQVGAPYRYGGRSPAGFDCSGLVSFAWAHAGRAVPRTTGGLWRGLRPVPKDSLQAGDVLFFDIEGKMSHVGLYLGDGRFVHAPATGRSVEVEELDSAYYRRAFIRAGRP